MPLLPSSFKSRHAPLLQIAMFAITVGLLAHLSACLFHYMALLTYFITDTWEGTWVAAQGLVDANLAHR
jgi:hypothetical protein